MKKFLLLLGAALMLTGCGAAETFETLGPVEHEKEVAAVMASPCLSLPEEVALAVFEQDNDKLYLCDEYTIMTRILPSGDLNATVTALCGYEKDALTVMESGADGRNRYDWVWTATSDDGDLVCRACVLDDGNYHYCLCVMAPAGSVGALSDTINSLFSSFSLA